MTNTKSIAFKCTELQNRQLSKILNDSTNKLVDFISTNPIEVKNLREEIGKSLIYSYDPATELFIISILVDTANLLFASQFLLSQREFLQLEGFQLSGS
jgi:Golgi nucleoside diphosphatase